MIFYDKLLSINKKLLILRVEMYIPLINNMMNRRKLPYVVPETRKVQVLTESGICAGSNVSVVQKDDKPLVEVDKWDEIGQEVTFD